MFIYPHINPVAIQLGPLKIHWYGFMYLVGFLSAWVLAKYRSSKQNNKWTTEMVSDVIFYSAIGVVIGGRVGYMLFYGLSDFINHPLSIFEIWNGGMAFHGGVIGVAIALLFFSKKYHLNFFDVTDFIVPFVPIGLGAGRIGNFINGELWGRVTTMPWGMIYPHVDAMPRHPSEVYEFLLEGVTLFCILWFYSCKPKPRMAVTGLFLLLYGVFRFSCEFFRQPDIQLGFVFDNWMSQGQLLSIPMIVLGAIFLLIAYVWK